MMSSMTPDKPAVDHHTHVFSPQSNALLASRINRSLPPITVTELLGVLDRDEITKAAVLSAAYFFARPGNDDAAAVAAENDYLAAEISKHRDRLAGFLSINPLCASSAAEIDRCASMPEFVGLKLHLANSEVDLRDVSHVTRLAERFEHANARGLVILVHMRTQQPEYGRPDAEIFIERVLPKASSVPVQIAHMAGWGGYDDATDGALGAFVDVVAGGGHDNLHFDISAAVLPAGVEKRGLPKQHPERLAGRIHQIGCKRVLFGTDWPEWTPRRYTKDLSNLPLGDDELGAIIANRAPWTEKS